MATKFHDATKGLLRSTVLSSVGELLRDKPLESLSMAEIAKLAGISRQSVYNEFGNRDELVKAYVLAEAASFLDVIEQRVEANSTSLKDGVNAAIVSFWELAESHPLLSSIASGEASEDLINQFITERDSTVLNFAAQRLSEVVRRLWPKVAEADVELVCELSARVALSQLSQPTSPFGLSPEKLLGPLEPYLESLER